LFLFYLFIAIKNFRYSSIEIYTTDCSQLNPIVIVWLYVSASCGFGIATWNPTECCSFTDDDGNKVAVEVVNAVPGAASTPYAV
jgi:hypothetical protein